MLDLIRPPWSPLQVATLNRCQASGLMHPFTCGNAHPLHQTLIADTGGWHCPDESCDYRQDWAYSFMADPDAVAALIESDPLRRGHIDKVQIDNTPVVDVGAAERAARQLHGAQIAYRIRAELVCCDLYGRVNDGSSYEQRKANFKARLAEIRRHDLCYWGEASARIAENPSRWQDDPSQPCDRGAPCLGSGCSHDRAAVELTRITQDDSDGEP